jgi:hypothetical protein
MKTIKYTFLVVFLGIAVLINAQSKFRVGVAGGLNYSKIKGHLLSNDGSLGLIQE